MTADDSTADDRRPPVFEPRYLETTVDRQIRLAQERGLFDDLPGAGKPLPNLGDPADENWWIKRKLEQEGLSGELLLPPSIQLRKELDRLPDTVAGMRSEAEVREAVAELNRRVAEHLRFPSGPRVHVAPVRVDDVLARWRAGRGAAEPRRAAPAPPTEPPPAARRRWWSRRTA